MTNDWGTFTLGGNVSGEILVVNDSNVPVAADGTVSYKIRGSDGVSLATGSFSAVSGSTGSYSLVEALGAGYARGVYYVRADYTVSSAKAQLCRFQVV